MVHCICRRETPRIQIVALSLGGNSKMVSEIPQYKMDANMSPHRRYKHSSNVLNRSTLWASARFDMERQLRGNHRTWNRFFQGNTTTDYPTPPLDVFLLSRGTIATSPSFRFSTVRTTGNVDRLCWFLVRFTHSFVTVALRRSTQCVLSNIWPQKIYIVPTKRKQRFVRAFKVASVDTIVLY